MKILSTATAVAILAFCFTTNIQAQTVRKDGTSATTAAKKGSAPRLPKCTKYLSQAGKPCRY